MTDRRSRDRTPRYPDGTRIEEGDRVRIERCPPPRGSWNRFVGRTGRVTTMSYGEVGVTFASTPSAHHSPDAWFRPPEVALVARQEGGGSAPLVPRDATDPGSGTSGPDSTPDASGSNGSRSRRTAKATS